MDRNLPSLCFKLFVACFLLSFNQLRGQITPGAGGIVYVNHNVTGGNHSGNSWANAVPELADVLLWARDQDLADPDWLGGDSIRVFVAEGTYKPLYNADEANRHTDGTIDNAFVLINKVYLYGGFPGKGNPGLQDRDWKIYPTVLSGDIGAPGDYTDNVCHVVIITGANPARQDKKIDGFVVTGGAATYSQQSPEVRIEDVEMQYVRTEAGGIFILAPGEGDVFSQVLNTTVTENHANFGGGVSIRTTKALLKNVIIKDNTAAQHGGGLISSGSNHSVIVNTLITGNNAASGGGIYSFFGAARYHNVTVAGNTATGQGNELYFENQVYDEPMLPKPDSARFFNCIVWHPGSNGITNVVVAIDTVFSVSHSIFPGTQLWPGAGNLNQAPVFTDVAGKDFSLRLTSPAINKGINDSVATSTPTDLAGKNRIVGSYVDMGAYENPDGATLPVSVVAFKGAYAVGLATVEWLSGLESHFDHYELESGPNGKEFPKVIRKTATGSHSLYKVTTPQEGPVAYYRLKLVDKDGSSRYYDKVIRIAQNTESKLSVYPNPAKKMMYLQVFKAGVLKIYDASGKRVKQVAVQIGKAAVNVESLAAGLYFCVLGEQRFSFVKAR